MITVKEYAERKGVTHQAVYKQLQTHAKELESFIVMNGRTRMLTDEAVAILEKYRETNPQIIERTNDKERVEELEEELDLVKKQLLFREAELQKKIAVAEKEAKEAYKKLEEKSNLIATAEANQLLLEEKIKEVGLLEGFIREAKEDKEITVKEVKDELIKKHNEAEKKLQNHYQEEISKLKIRLEERINKAEEELEKEKSRKLSLTEAFKRVIGR